MCMEDIKIGRKIARRLTTIPVTNNTVKLVLDRSEKRVLVQIWVGTNDNVFFGFDSNIVAPTNGFVVTEFSNGQKFTIQEHGQTCFGPFFATSTGDVNVTILEGLLEDER